KHHEPVKIKDGALVAAAVLSNRYIADRFLPDKAIDLVDEAAAKLRTEIDSMPQELDEPSRRIMQLKIEEQALLREKDAASKERLTKLRKELADLEEEVKALKARWQEEKQAVEQAGKLNTQIAEVKMALEHAMREGNYAKAGELQYSALPQLEQQLRSAEAG